MFVVCFTKRLSLLFVRRMSAEGVESLRELECVRLNTSKVPQPFSRRFLRGGTTRALDNAVDRLKLLLSSENVSVIVQ